MTDVIRVVIADDSILLRTGVERILAEIPDIDVVASCEDADTLLNSVTELAPDVVVTDIRMPPHGTDDGLQVATALRRSTPGLGVVILSQYADPEYALALLDDGIEGRAYLLKERISQADQLTGAIREVASGGSVIDPQIVHSLVQARQSSPSSRLVTLTARELEVLSLVARGMNNAAAARTLALTERAIEKHINTIFSKLGLSETTDVNRRVTATLMYLADVNESS